MVANILATDPPPPDPGDGFNRQNLTFSEQGHVAYQIKGHHSSKYLVHIPSPDPYGHKVKIQPLQNMIRLHNKLKRMEHSAPCKHI